MRRSAASALIKFGLEAKRAVPALIAALEDKDSIVRFSVASALGAMGPAARRAVSALTEALKDGDKNVRLAAAKAITDIKGKK